MNSNDGINIPQNLAKGIMVMHHTDNIDWNEDTPDGKNSSHLLQVSTFQQSTNQPRKPFTLDLDTKSHSLTLLPSTSYH